MSTRLILWTLQRCLYARSAFAGVTATIAATVLTMMPATYASDVTIYEAVTSSFAATTVSLDGYVLLRRLEDGRVELRYRPAGAPLKDRIAPIDDRFLAPNARQDNWFQTGSIVRHGQELGHVEARRLREDRIQVAFTPSGGSRILPEANTLAAGSRVGVWYRATEISFTLSISEPSDVLARALFGGERYVTGYNDFGARGEGQTCSGVHYGWDLQTASVVKMASDEEPFFSLTRGTVVKIDDSVGGIRVWGGEEHDATVIYLHARSIEVKVDDPVDVGQRLGVQGNVGLQDKHWDDGSITVAEKHYYDEHPYSYSEHVHVELRWGRYEDSLCARGAINPVIDADFYLVRSVLGTID